MRYSPQMPSARRWATLVALATSLILTVSCSSSKHSSSATSTPTTAPAAVCSDYEALETSLNNLTSLNVMSVGTNGLKAALNDVTSKANALASSSHQEFTPQIDALKTAVSNLSNTIKNVPNGGLRTALGTIGAQLSAIGVAGHDLKTAVGSACPTATST